MKKTYTNPELEIVVMNAADIVTVSDQDKEQNLWQPTGSGNKNWDEILGSGYVNRN